MPLSSAASRSYDAKIENTATGVPSYLALFDTNREWPFNHAQRYTDTNGKLTLGGERACSALSPRNFVRRYTTGKFRIHPSFMLAASLISNRDPLLPAQQSFNGICHRISYLSLATNDQITNNRGTAIEQTLKDGYIGLKNSWLNLDRHLHPDEHTLPDTQTTPDWKSRTEALAVEVAQAAEGLTQILQGIKPQHLGDTDGKERYSWESERGEEDFESDWEEEPVMDSEEAFASLASKEPVSRFAPGLRGRLTSVVKRGLRMDRSAQE